MPVVTMAIVGVACGFVLDYLVSRLAREPYERTDHGDAAEPAPRASEVAQLAIAPARARSSEMPSLLTTHALYRTAVIVTVTAAVFSLIGLRYRGGGDVQFAVAAFYASVLIVCASTDVLSYRVPNSVTYPAIVGAFIIGMVIPGANRLDVTAGGLVFGGLLFVPSILTGGAMGMGDVKLALFVGFALGLTFVVPAMLVMAMSGGLAAVLLIATGLRGKGDPIPYAPFIAGGALLVLLLQGTAFRVI